MASGWGLGGECGGSHPSPADHLTSTWPSRVPLAAARAAKRRLWLAASRVKQTSGWTRAALGPEQGLHLCRPPVGAGPRALLLAPWGQEGDLPLSPGLIHPASAALLWYSQPLLLPLPTGRGSMATGLEGLKLSCLRQPSDPHPHPKAWFLPHPHTSDPDLPPASAATINQVAHPENSSPPGWGRPTKAYQGCTPA